jgi:hypothetical protein
MWPYGHHTILNHQNERLSAGLISRLIGYYHLPQSEIETIQIQQLDLQSVNGLGRSRKKLLLVVSAEPAQASKYTHTHNIKINNTWSTGTIKEKTDLLQMVYPSLL